MLLCAVPQQRALQLTLAALMRKIPNCFQAPAGGGNCTAINPAEVCYHLEILIVQSTSVPETGRMPYDVVLFRIQAGLSCSAEASVPISMFIAALDVYAMYPSDNKRG